MPYKYTIYIPVEEVVPQWEELRRKATSVDDGEEGFSPSPSTHESPASATAASPESVEDTMVVQDTQIMWDGVSDPTPEGHGTLVEPSAADVEPLPAPAVAAEAEEVPVATRPALAREVGCEAAEPSAAPEVELAGGEVIMVGETNLMDLPVEELQSRLEATSEKLKKAKQPGKLSTC